MSKIDQQLVEKMQYIGGLFFRRLHDELSESDQAALEGWLAEQEPSSRRFFEEMADWEQIKTALHYLYQVDTPSALADAQKKILLDNDRRPAPTPKAFFLWKPIYKYAAAALLAVIVGGAAVFVLTHRKTNIADLPVTRRFRNDVAPGGRRAMLELADGSRIVLDSAANGEVVHQGSIRVLKLDDGQLAYRVADNRGEAATGQVGFNTISTPRGGQYQVVLPDGSKVWLNAASSLRFPTQFTGRERTVELTGEAYFEVAHQASMPFKVQVAPLQVEVIGTHFDIEAYPDEPERKVTLLQGAVKATAGNEQALLQPGQQARLDGNGPGALRVVAPVYTEDVMAWKNGLFRFRESSIQSVMRQIARWYDVEVAYEGKVDFQFFGKVPQGVPLSTLLKILESTGGVHFMIEGKKITVAP